MMNIILESAKFIFDEARFFLVYRYVRTGQEV